MGARTLKSLTSNATFFFFFFKKLQYLKQKQSSKKKKVTFLEFSYLCLWRELGRREGRGGGGGGGGGAGAGGWGGRMLGHLWGGEILK